jgi:cold shock CspA family protein
VSKKIHSKQEDKKMRQQGIVRWFDRLSGEGMVRGADGKSHWVFGCNLIGAKTLFEHTACMYLVEGEAVEFELHDGCGAVKVSGGHFDAEKWNSLDQSKLAFKVGFDGQLESGLFAGKVGAL